MTIFAAIMKLTKGLGQTLEHPLQSLDMLRALIRGLFYMIFFSLFRSNVAILFPFFAYEKVRIIGTGTVHIDRFCAVYRNMSKGLTIVTLSPSAIVHIGENCRLSGLTIRCSNKISLGDNTMTAYSLIQDSYIINREQHNNGKGIEIGKNVWIGAQACILDGTIIGDDTVISLGSVCLDTNIGEYRLAAGSPVFRSIPIAQIFGVREKL